MATGASPRHSNRAVEGAYPTLLLDECRFEWTFKPRRRKSHITLHTERQRLVYRIAALLSRAPIT